MRILTLEVSLHEAQVEDKAILGYDDSQQIKKVLVGFWEKLRQKIKEVTPS